MKFRYKKRDEDKPTIWVGDFRSHHVEYDEQKFHYRRREDGSYGSERGVHIESRSDDDCFTMWIMDATTYYTGRYRVLKEHRKEFAEGILAVLYGQEGELIVEQ